jgi:hypothetical protein
MFSGFLQKYDIPALHVCGVCIYSQNDETDIKNDSSINTSLYHPFKLPIHYLDNSCVFDLSPIVSSDLELVLDLDAQKTINEMTSASEPVDYASLENNNSMYSHMLKPTNYFAKMMISEWSKSYTTNVDFLKNTQSILKETEMYKTRMKSLPYTMNCDTVLSVWNDTTNNEEFLDKYSYMDWTMFKFLNESSPFLQVLSTINITSPIISIILPVIFLVVPFFLLKCQGIPISFSVYLDTLKEIAKNHFIGKALINLNNITFEKLCYLVFLMGLYILQIYQNINICNRFYKNIKCVNTNLIELRNYLDYVCESMTTFCDLHQDKSTYTEFCNDIRTRCSVLDAYKKRLNDISQFSINFKTINKVGYLLKTYYALHNDEELKTSLKFSFGYSGFIDNMLGIYDNLASTAINFAVFNDGNYENNTTDDETATKPVTEPEPDIVTDTNTNMDTDMDTDKCDLNIVGQYYPPLKDEKYIDNDCNLSKNMIISGPNASGKTTYIKTTCINIIFSQQFGCGFYKECNINPYTHIHSYINIPDSSGRDSLFQAESRRCKEIIDIINKDKAHRHFCIFDELFSGTNPVEATKAGYALLMYLTKYKNVKFILTTHYKNICKQIKRRDNISNYKMIVKKKDGHLKYTYKIARGISKIRGALNVLKELEFPDEIIRVIKKNNK